MRKHDEISLVAPSGYFLKPDWDSPDCAQPRNTEFGFQFEEKHFHAGI
jgi:hypothetical protein